jgi:hypothetical protein
MWVPPGRWADWWTGVVHTGPQWVARNFSLFETPLLARAGGIVPMKALADSAALAPARLQLAVAFAPSSAGSGLVYEDDGESLLYKGGAFATHLATFSATAAAVRLVVAPGADGDGYPGAPATRAFEARFRGAPPSATNATCENCAADWGARWEAEGALAVFIIDTGLVASVSTVLVGFGFA